MSVLLGVCHMGCFTKTLCHITRSSNHHQIIIKSSLRRTFRPCQLLLCLEAQARSLKTVSTNITSGFRETPLAIHPRQTCTFLGDVRHHSVLHYESLQFHNPWPVESCILKERNKRLFKDSCRIFTPLFGCDDRVEKHIASALQTSTVYLGNPCERRHAFGCGSQGSCTSALCLT